MKKHIFTFLALFLCASIAWADVDSSTDLKTYYATIDGKATDSQDNLRKELCAVISNGYISIGYSALKNNMFECVGLKILKCQTYTNRD